MNQIALDPARWTDLEPAPPRAREPVKHRWTAKQVTALWEVRAFGDRRVELIDGEVYEMPPEGELHQTLRTRIQNSWVIDLHVASPETFIIGTNGPVRLGENDEPEPDIHIYPADLPLADIHGPQSLLVVEIASTSHAHDFGRKVPQYARFGVPELWIIDAVKRVTVVHRGPDPDGTWASVTRHGEGEAVSPLALPGLGFRLADYPSPAATAGA